MIFSRRRKRQGKSKEENHHHRHHHKRKNKFAGTSLTRKVEKKNTYFLLENRTPNSQLGFFFFFSFCLGFKYREKRPTFRRFVVSFLMLSLSNNFFLFWKSFKNFFGYDSRTETRHIIE